MATPFVTRRHVHPAVPQAARPATEATGIDYLGLVAAAHDADTADQDRLLPAPLFADPEIGEGAR